MSKEFDKNGALIYVDTVKSKMQGHGKSEFWEYRAEFYDSKNSDDDDAEEMVACILMTFSTKYVLLDTCSLNYSGICSSC